MRKPFKPHNFRNNMQDDKNKVEAVLFTTGRFLSLEEISKMTGIGSLGYLKELIHELLKEYSEGKGALEIIQQGEKFKLNIKKDYLYLTENLLTDTELDRPTQETLAVIAYKNPALQSEIIKIRGNGAYDHIKILKELDFINTEPIGKSQTLKLTSKFYDYFDIVEDHLRSKLKSQGEKTEPVIEGDNQKSDEGTNGDQVKT